jgi:hypothetical protein
VVKPKGSGGGVSRKTRNCIVWFYRHAVVSAEDVLVLPNGINQN